MEPMCEENETMGHWELIPLDEREHRFVKDCIAWMRCVDGFKDDFVQVRYKGDFILTEQVDRMFSDLIEKVRGVQRSSIRRHCREMVEGIGWHCGIHESETGNIIEYMQPPVIVDGKLHVRMTYTYIPRRLRVV